MNPAAPRPSLPAGIWVLGFVSLLMDISSEMIHALLPLFMVGTLGMSVALVGLLEGLAEATALILKVFSGVISDWFGKRKPLAVLGPADADRPVALPEPHGLPPARGRPPGGAGGDEGRRPDLIDRA